MKTNNNSAIAVEIKKWGSISLADAKLLDRSELETLFLHFQDEIESLTVPVDADDLNANLFRIHASNAQKDHVTAEDLKSIDHSSLALRVVLLLASLTKLGQAANLSHAARESKKRNQTKVLGLLLIAGLGILIWFFAR